MTSPVTNQGPAIQGMSTPQQGYAPGFPPPLGLEQYLGQPQQYVGFVPQYGGFVPQYGGFPSWYGSPQQFSTQPQFPGQPQLSGQQPFSVQQIVPSLVSQLLPIAQQVILPQVVATATQQIPWYLQQIVTQQLTGQQTPFGQMAPNPFGRIFPGTF